MNRWERLDEAVDRVEGVLLVLFLSLMILIAFLQVLLRNLFSTGISWGDPFVRNLVLWTGFIGAALATREAKHINIDLVSRGISPKAKAIIETFTNLIAALVCGLLTYGALKFIKNEAETGNVTFLGVPVWVPELVLPLTFAIMTLRFVFRSLKNLSPINSPPKANHWQGKV